MRKTLLALAALGAVAGIAVPTAASATTAEDRHCYSLGLPGQPHYEYCTYLPIDPNDIIR